jgi:hypothetical protein
VGLANGVCVCVRAQMSVWGSANVGVGQCKCRCGAVQMSVWGSGRVCEQTQNASACRASVCACSCSDLVALVEDSVPDADGGWRGDGVEEDGEDPVERKHGEVDTETLEVKVKLVESLLHKLAQNSLVNLRPFHLAREVPLCARSVGFGIGVRLRAKDMGVGSTFTLFRS